MGSVTVAAASGLIGVTSLVVLALLAARTPTKERLLIARFGQPYRDYMARTAGTSPGSPAREDDTVLT